MARPILTRCPPWVVPSPYWLQERALSLRYGLLPPGEGENFSGHTYTIASALDLLVRRLCRQAVKRVWPEASRLVFCNYVHDKSEDWFVW